MVRAIVLLLFLFLTAAGHAQGRDAQGRDEYANDPFDPRIARDAWTLIGQTEQRAGVPLGLLHAMSLVESGKGIRGWMLPWPYTIGVNSAGKRSFLTASSALQDLRRLRGLGFVRFDVRAGSAYRASLTYQQALDYVGANARQSVFVIESQPFGRRFNNEAEAEAFVYRMFAGGHRNLDIGMMQVNWKVHGQHFGSVRQALDPQRNVNYAVTYLLQHRQTRDWWGSVGRYHSGTAFYANRYIKRVWAMYQRVHRLRVA